MAQNKRHLCPQCGEVMCPFEELSPQERAACVDERAEAGRTGREGAPYGKPRPSKGWPEERPPRGQEQLAGGKPKYFCRNCLLKYGGRA